jgi:hypothetical protein
MGYVKSQRETKGYGMKSHLQNKGYLTRKSSKKKCFGVWSIKTLTYLTWK